MSNKRIFAIGSIVGVIVFFVTRYFTMPNDVDCTPTPNAIPEAISQCLDHKIWNDWILPGIFGACMVPITFLALIIWDFFFFPED